MIAILSGLVVTGAGGAGLWYCMPRNGQPRPLAKVRFLDSPLPIAIVSALAIGVAPIIAGLV